MKKLNRAPRKGDSLALAAQSEKPGTNATLKVENEIASFETGFTEEQRLYRTRGGGYVLATELTEVLDDDGSWIRAHLWRLKTNPSLSPLEMRTFEPFELLPPARLRVRKISRKVTWEQALRWLDKHIVGNMIPEEFQKAFCPRSTKDLRKLNAEYEKLKQTIRRLEIRMKLAPKNAQLCRVEIDYRSLLCGLLGLDVSATGRQIDRAIVQLAR